MITLQSNRLHVEISEPGENRNNTTRFDRAGFITRVCLDGKHEFCTVEPNNLIHPCSGGVGLCSEILDQGLWSDTPVGGKCPKFGVGLLTKPGEDKYKFYEKYETQPFPVRIIADGAAVIFDTEPVPCQGYALRQRKTVTVVDNTVTVDYKVENAGEKIVSLGEYVHNFVTIDKKPIGPAYTISMPTVSPQDGKTPRFGDATLKGRGSGFTYTGYSNSAAIIFIDGEEIDPKKPFSWTITHADTTASVTEEDSFIPAQIPLWTIDHIISPEVYIRYELVPGQVKTYQRKWIFCD